MNVLVAIIMKNLQLIIVYSRVNNDFISNYYLSYISIDSRKVILFIRKL